MMSVPPAAPAPTSSPQLAAARARHGLTFHQFLSELNPLQYLPVIGTLYRAITGDTVPEDARDVGSLVVSGLTGGPVGVATGLAALAVEKATGIDPDKIGQQLLAGIGVGHAAPHPAAHAPAAVAVHAPAAPPAVAGWSAAQLAAYGVTKTADGTLRLGDLRGSDVLNALELARPGVSAIRAA